MGFKCFVDHTSFDIDNNDGPGAPQQMVYKPAVFPSTHCSMKPLILSLALASLLTAPAIFASDTYQVTGNVVAVDASKITVKKGKENFEMTLGASAKVPADVKVGSKVTVHYNITATDVESKDKPAPAKKEAAPAKPAKAPKAAAPAKTS